MREKRSGGTDITRVLKEPARRVRPCRGGVVNVMRCNGICDGMQVK